MLSRYRSSGSMALLLFINHEINLLYVDQFHEKWEQKEIMQSKFISLNKAGYVTSYVVDMKNKKDIRTY